MKKSEEKNIEVKPEKIVKKEPKIIEEKPKKDYFKIFKDWVIKNSKSIITILVILIVLILCGKIIGYFNSPEYIANKYFKAIANNDYSKIYDLIDVDDSALVNEKVLEDKISSLGVDAYKLESIQETEDNALITYKYEHNNQVYVASVLLRKSMQNKYLVFNNWKVQSSKVVNNITIKVPVNSVVKVDNTNIKEFLTESTDEYDIYTIEEMISGKYNVSIELENGLKAEDEINVASNSTYVVGDIELEDNVKTELQNQLSNYLATLYNNAIGNKNYDETGLDKLKDEYVYLRSSLQNKGYILTGISFSDITVSSSTYDTMLEVTFSVNCNYNINYNLNDTVNTYNGSGLTDIKANFKVEDGKYTLNSINNLPISFRIR